jgi:hypothetical protein
VGPLLGLRPIQTSHKNGHFFNELLIAPLLRNLTALLPGLSGAVVITHPKQGLAQPFPGNRILRVENQGGAQVLDGSLELI